METTTRVRAVLATCVYLSASFCVIRLFFSGPLYLLQVHVHVYYDAYM
jgi:hypothetical protein